MIIIDKTPHRSEDGAIGPFGLLQGTLKYGLTWQSRLKAQDAVIAIIEKQLDSNFALLRNVTLPNTDIMLPLVLIGPPGISLINVLHERGVYKARDDQWGTMIGDKFMPARVNQLARTTTFGRVLQVYLDRQGFKGQVVVDSILMAADPGMQIESTRPSARVVMSDAIERFSASLSHARQMIDARLGKEVVRALLVGTSDESEDEPEDEAIEEDVRSSSYDTFSFNDEESEPEPIKTEAPRAQSQPNDKQPKQDQTTAKPQKSGRKKKGPLGLTTGQLTIVGVFGFVTVCFIIAGVIFILNTLH
jgi:hypothetical protein